MASQGSFSTTGTTDTVCIDNPVVVCAGTWSGGTMTWEVQGSDGTWRTARTGTTSLAYTADHRTMIDAPRAVNVRGILSGTTAAPTLSWYIQ